MKKNLIFTIVFLLTGCCLFSQNAYTVSGGLLGGANFSKFTNDNVDYKYKFGFDAGVWVNFPLGNVLSLEPQVLYSHRDYTPKDNDGTNVTSKLGFISVPLFLKASLGDKFAIMAGPEFNYLANSSDSFNNFDKEDFKEWSTAVTGGIEFAPHSRLTIYGKYSYGFVDMFRFDDGNTAIQNEPYKNSSFHLGLKFKLFGHKVSRASEPEPVPVAVAPEPEKDADGDGIVDSKDKCPNEKGLAKYQGCPVPDTDGDGIDDEADMCPKTPGITGNYGCPEIILYYTRDSADLNETDKKDLDKVVVFLKNHPDVNVFIEGHTSTLGEEDYNQKLSEKRAKGSVDYLVANGISASRLSAVGYGEKYPIGDNSKEEGRAKSRRVVVKIKK